MKTENELIGQILKEKNGCDTVRIKKEILRFIGEFGTEIRKDQDKITRKACFDSIDKLHDETIDVNIALYQIINTKAI